MGVMSEQTPEHESPPAQDSTGNGTAGEPSRDRVVVVTPEGMGVAHQGGQSPADLVESPAKVMRIGAMVKQLLEEVRSAPLDDAGRQRLAAIHDTAVAELKESLAPELDEELDRLVQPFKSTSPSDAELRIAQAQLVGWLEGLFHGLQTALVAQQMAAQAQLQEMRRALPGGPGMTPSGPSAGSDGAMTGADPKTGQYL
ncbi:MAG: proteasome activator [Nostocoides sp.]